MVKKTIKKIVAVLCVLLMLVQIVSAAGPVATSGDTESTESTILKSLTISDFEDQNAYGTVKKLKEGSIGNSAISMDITYGDSKETDFPYMHGGAGQVYLSSKSANQGFTISRVKDDVVDSVTGYEGNIDDNTGMEYLGIGACMFLDTDNPLNGRLPAYAWQISAEEVFGAGVTSFANRTVKVQIFMEVLEKNYVRFQVKVNDVLYEVDNAWQRPDKLYWSEYVGKTYIDSVESIFKGDPTWSTCLGELLYDYIGYAGNIVSLSSVTDGNSYQWNETTKAYEPLVMEATTLRPLTISDFEDQNAYGTLKKLKEGSIGNSAISMDITYGDSTQTDFPYMHGAAGQVYLSSKSANQGFSISRVKDDVVDSVIGYEGSIDDNTGMEYLGIGACMFLDTDNPLNGRLPAYAWQISAEEVFGEGVTSFANRTVKVQIFMEVLENNYVRFQVKVNDVLYEVDNAWQRPDKLYWSEYVGKTYIDSVESIFKGDPTWSTCLGELLYDYIGYAGNIVSLSSVTDGNSYQWNETTKAYEPLVMEVTTLRPLTISDFEDQNAYGTLKKLKEGSIGNSAISMDITYGDSKDTDYSYMHGAAGQVYVSSKSANQGFTISRVKDDVVDSVIGYEGGIDDNTDMEFLGIGACMFLDTDNPLNGRLPAYAWQISAAEVFGEGVTSFANRTVKVQIFMEVLENNYVRFQVKVNDVLYEVDNAWQRPDKLYWSEYVGKTYIDSVESIFKGDPTWSTCLGELLYDYIGYAGNIEALSSVTDTNSYQWNAITEKYESLFEDDNDDNNDNDDNGGESNESNKDDNKQEDKEVVGAEPNPILRPITMSDFEDINQWGTQKQLKEGSIGGTRLVFNISYGPVYDPDLAYMHGQGGTVYLFTKELNKGFAISRVTDGVVDYLNANEGLIDTEDSEMEYLGIGAVHYLDNYVADRLGPCAWQISAEEIFGEGVKNFENRSVKVELFFEVLEDYNVKIQVKINDKLYPVDNFKDTKEMDYAKEYVGKTYLVSKKYNGVGLGELLENYIGYSGSIYGLGSSGADYYYKFNEKTQAYEEYAPLNPDDPMHKLLVTRIGDIALMANGSHVLDPGLPGLETTVWQNLPQYLIGLPYIRIQNWMGVDVEALEDCYVYILGVSAILDELKGMGFKQIAYYPAGYLCTEWTASGELFLLEKKVSKGERISYGKEFGQWGTLMTSKTKLRLMEPLKDYTGCEAIYFSEEKGAMYVLYKDKNLVYVENGVEKKGTYGVDVYVNEDSVINITVGGVRNTYPYSYQKIIDKDGYLFRRLGTYRVRFETGEGSAVEDYILNAENGYITAKPEDPTLEGCKFLGWYTDSGEEYIFGEMETETISLYAKWSGFTYAKEAANVETARNYDWVYIVISATVFLAGVAGSILILKKGKKNNGTI